MKQYIRELIKEAKNKISEVKPLKPQPRVICQCGHCEKCYHRNYMRARRKHIEIENFYLQELEEKVQQIYSRIPLVRKIIR